MHKRIALAAVIAAFVPATSPAEAHHGNRPACQEDNRCWNWATMGNHKRGIVSMWGTPLVVGPNRFCRMMKNGNVDIRGDRMRGDRTALKTCN